MIRNAIQKADFVNKCICFSQLICPFCAFCMVLTLAGLRVFRRPQFDTKTGCTHNLGCCFGLKPILDSIRKHVVTCSQPCETTMNRSICSVYCKCICSKFGFSHNGHTVVIQNHITTSFTVESITQQASGYHVYASYLSVTSSLYVLSIFLVSLLVTSLTPFSFLSFSFFQPP